MLMNKKEQRLKNAAQRAEFDQRATQEVGDGHYEARGGDDDEDPELEVDIRASLEHAAFERDRVYYLGSHFEYSGGSGSSVTSSAGSTSAPESMDRSGSIPSGSQIGRSSSMRVPQSRGDSRGDIRRFFTNLGESGRKTNVDIFDHDPRAFPPPSAKQPRIDNAWGKTKKWELGRAISKWFHFSRIPANAANNPYYRILLSTIHKNQLAMGEYGCNLMCNSWTGPIRMSIINFLIYCNRRVVYHKSVNSSDEIHDAYYISKLMIVVIKEIGPQNIVQIITDNGANFKRVGYYLNPAYQYKYDLGLVDSLLHPLRKVIQRMSGSNREASQALNESKWFRDATDNFRDSFAISIRDTMDREKLVYVHYNMQLRMRALQNEDRNIPYIDPSDVGFDQGDADPIIDWWIRQVRRRSTSDSLSSPLPTKAKGKGKVKRLIDPLDAIAEAEEDEEDEPSVHSSSSTKDEGDEDDDRAGGKDIVVLSTPTPTDLWTNEQYFDHYTQDQDHGARTGGTTQVYEKRGRRQGGRPTVVQDYHHDMMSILQEISESTYYVSSTYSTNDTRTSSWTANKETLMDMWYNRYQGMIA
ncbi:hypothetical protein Cni_G26111 [Canna indica]|uniref:DUF659 domain-containing protein n=1 Tax=Canna indica TaxID=4628 RepID=A0AAQ3KZ82_9LILI|nr:hypothetical protein Cni_G26111 [Canna indica]